jgi:hypothetical protein
VKRCGKSAPRVRQRKRHGKPHREQDRIGTATRAVRASDNSAGQCQARRPGRLLEATCKRCPRGMAVTYRLPQAGGALQNPAYRPADILRRGALRQSGVPFRRKHTSPKMWGSAPTRRTPRQFNPYFIGFLSSVTTLVTTIHSDLCLNHPIRKEPTGHCLSPGHELDRCHWSNHVPCRCGPQGYRSNRYGKQAIPIAGPVGGWEPAKLEAVLQINPLLSLLVRLAPRESSASARPKPSP